MSGSFADLITMMSGAGSETWTGTANAWTAEVSGSGSVNARELRVDEAHLTNSGIGSLGATVQRTLAASVSGLGCLRQDGGALDRRFSATAAWIKALNASTSSTSPSRMSMARRVFPSRLELKSP